MCLGPMKLRHCEHTWLAVWLVLVGVAGLTGCGDDATPTPAEATVTALEISPNKATLRPGATQQFDVIRVWSDGIRTVENATAAVWSSSDVAVATVTDAGLATAVASGTATVEVTLGGEKATAAVTVTSKTLVALNLTPNAGTVAVGGILQLNLTGTYDDGTTADVTAQATWSTNEVAVASVDGAGKVGGAGGGEATISAALSGLVATATVTVLEKKLLIIQVTPALTSVAIQATQQFTATANYDDGSTANVTTTATWASSATGDASISSTGLAKGLIGGTAVTISATFGGKTGIAALSVSSATYVSLSVSPATATVSSGQTQEFEATATMSDGTIVPVSSLVSWSSAKVAVATINTHGIATGVSVGEAEIAATLGPLTSKVTLKVTDAVATALVISPSAATTFVGGPVVVYTAQATLSDGSKKDVSTLATWAIDKAAVATIDTKGTVTPKSEGSASVTASYQGVTAASALVFVGPSVVVSLQVLPSSATIAKGTLQSFQAIATFSDGSKLNLSSSVAWQSSDAKLATVDNGGLATGVASGAVTVTATYVGKFATATLTVSAATLTSIDLYPAAFTPIPISATRQFTAIGNYSDNTTQDVTAQAVWLSSNPAIFSVLNNAGMHGLVTAVSTGTANLSAGIGDIISPTVAVKVQSGITLSSITLFPTSVNLVEGQALQQSAIGHYSDGSAFDVNQSATWSVVDSKDTATAGYATVKNGFVTALGSTANVNGGLRIKAQLGAVVAYAPLNVKANKIIGISVFCGGPLSCLPASVGYRVGCTATASFDDGTTGDVTSTATWASSIFSVASIPVVDAGVAYSTVGVAGTAAITASQGGKTSLASTASTVMVTALQLQTISVTPPTTSLSRGFTMQSQATGVFTSAGCGTISRTLTQLVTWSSSISGVASVSNAPGTKGVASALKSGTTTLYAVLGLVSGSSQLKVVQSCVQKVQVEQVNPTLPSLVFKQLSVVAYYSDAPTVPVPLVPGSVGAWSSAAVNPKTWMLSVPPGGSLSLQFSLLSGACGAAIGDTTKVAVDANALPTTLSLVPGAAQIAKGGFHDFVARATYQKYGAFVVSGHSTWSNAPTVGLSAGPVNGGLAERFLHQGTLAGSTQIAAAYKNRTASASLLITGALVKSVEIIGTMPSVSPQLGIPVGLNLRFAARVTWSDGTTTDNPSGLTFSSSAPSKLVILGGNLGRTLGTSAGVHPKVFASYGGATSAGFDVFISGASLVDLQFSPPSGSTMPRNSETPVTVTGLYSDGTSFDVSQQVIGASGNSTVITLAISGSGVRLISYDATTTTPVKMTFSKDGISRDNLVSVSGSCLSALRLDPATSALAVGQSWDFLAKATDSGGAEANVSSSGGWSISNTVVHNLGATTGPANRYLAVAKGTTAVGFTMTSAAVCAGGDTTKHTLTVAGAVQVSDAVPVSVVLSPRPIAPATARRVPLGQTLQLVALATMSDGTIKDLTRDAGTTYSTQNPQIAAVSQTGALIAQGVGSTIVTAVASNGVKADLVIEVQNCGVPALTLLPSTGGNLPVDTTRDYAANAMYAAGAACTATLGERFYNVTAMAVFSSSKPAVASIGSGGALAGRAYARQPGQAFISATFLGATSSPIAMNVVSVTLKSLTISAASTTHKNGTVPVVVTAIYTDGATDFAGLSAPPLAWNFVDPTVASVGANHILTGLKAGATKYFAQVGAVVSNTVTVTVSAACVNAVKLTTPAEPVEWPRGVPFQLEATCTTSDGSALPCLPVYSAIDPDNVLDPAPSFAQNGKGRIGVGATAGKSAAFRVAVLPQDGACAGVAVVNSVKVTVGGATISEIDLMQTAVAVGRGMLAVFTTRGGFTGGAGAGYYDLTPVAQLASNNPTVAAPLNDGSGGVLATNTDGTALITSSYLGMTTAFSSVVVSGKAPVALTVTAEDNLVGGTAASATYPIGGMQLQLVATVKYSDNTFGAVNPSTTWALQAPVLADTAIGEDGLFVTGSVAGSQVVVATLGGISKAFTVTMVDGTIVDVTILSVNGGAPVNTVPKGGSQPYVATFKLSKGTVAGPFWSGRNLDWAVSNATVATLQTSGEYHHVNVLHGLALGIVNLTAVVGASTGGPFAVTIVDTVPVALACSPASTTVTAGSHVQLFATATNADGSTNDVSAWVMWDVSSDETLSVDNAGLGSATGIGSVNVWPELGNLVAGKPCVVTVKAP